MHSGILLDQHRHNARRHQVRHGSRQHRPETKPRQVVAAIGHQRSNAADLHADGAEVGESAQRKCRNGEGSRRERAWAGLHQTKLRIRDELIQHGARAQQVADGFGLVPGNADQPRHRRAEEAEDRVQRVRKRNVPVRPGEV